MAAMGGLAEFEGQPDRQADSRGMSDFGQSRQRRRDIEDCQLIQT